MTKFDSDFDYLLLLGIDPDQALRAPATLSEGIKARKKEWTAQALNPLYAANARLNLERAREFDGILAVPDALAAYIHHVKECRIALRGEHEAALMLLVALAVGEKRELTAKQRELIIKEAKADGLPESLLDEILKSRSIPLVGVKPKQASAEPVAKLPLQAPALDGTIMSDIQSWLKILNKKSLYELLDQPSTTPPPRLISAAQLLFAHWSKVLPKTNTCTAWEKTLQSCLTYLKDADSKAKYDRAIFNQKVLKLASRIDLVLAGSTFGPEEQANIIRMGVQEFGFIEAVVEKCLAAQMATRGVSSESKATIVVQVQGQIRCKRCGIWNGAKQAQCRECASSLHRKCDNPSCRASPMPVDAKACPSCGLPVARAVRYRTLLRLADAFLDGGHHQAALSVCQHASQTHPGPAIDERLARSARIRELASTVKTQAASQSWLAVTATLKELIKLAPRMDLPGIPSLEKITQYLVESIDKIRAVPADADPVEAAKIYLAHLRRWTDCDEAFQKLRTITRRWESDRDPRRASQLVGKLLEIRPGDAELKATLVRLEPEMRRAEVLEAEKQVAAAEYLAAVREGRLLAAERSLQAIETTSHAGMSLPGSDELRRTLLEVRREVVELKQLAATQMLTDAVIDRSLTLLRRCRDQREILTTLQTAAIAPPSPPESLSIRREGNRRLLSWRPAGSGKRPTAYVVQRSIARPGSRQVDPPFQTFYEGDALHVSDDEVAHGGVILRYMVHAVARGRIEVDGTTIRTFEVTSAPSAFKGVLIWQEVMNFRSSRVGRSLEFTWFTPPGSRSVLIERWPGGPDDYGLGATILPATAEGRLVDEGLGEGMVHTYRISCVYDGPDGEFRTPGVSLTDGVVALASKPRDSSSNLGSGTPSSNGS
jgi:hypothetical protein